MSDRLDKNDVIIYLLLIAVMMLMMMMMLVAACVCLMRVYTRVILDFIDTTHL